MSKKALTKEQLSAIRRKAGSKGGRATVTRYGAAHMSEIGRKGAAIFWQRYKLFPMGAGDFALIRRDTGEYVASMTNFPPPER